jgi:hypothetical protein
VKAAHRHRQAEPPALEREVARARVLVRLHARQVVVKGKGANLPDPTLTNLPLPVTAQVINPDTGACVEAVFNTASENTDTIFKAKAP